MLVMPNIGDFIATAFGLALLLVGILLIVIVIVGKVKLFQKCGKEGWKAIIPFYSDYVFTREICGLHWAWFVGLLVIDLYIVTSSPTATIIRFFVKAISFYNLALKCHKDPIPSFIFGGLFSGIVTCVYGFGRYDYDKYVDVKPSALF